MFDDMDFTMEMAEMDSVMELSPGLKAHALDKMLKDAQRHSDHGILSDDERQALHHFQVGYEKTFKKPESLHPKRLIHHIKAQHRLAQAERMAARINGERLGHMPKSRKQAMQSLGDVSGHWAKVATVRAQNNSINRANAKRKAHLKNVFPRRSEIRLQRKVDRFKRKWGREPRLGDPISMWREAQESAVVVPRINRPVLEISNKLIRHAAEKAKKRAKQAYQDYDAYNNLAKVAKYHGAESAARSNQRNADAALAYSKRKAKQAEQFYATANYRADRQNFLSGRNDIGMKTGASKSEIAARTPSRSYFRRRNSSGFTNQVIMPTVTAKAGRRYGAHDQVGLSDPYHMTNMELQLGGYKTRRRYDTSLEKKPDDARPDNVPKIKR